MTMIGWSTWDLYAFDGLYYSLFLFTIPATLPIIQFFNEGKGYFIHSYSRIVHYKRTLVKAITQYACVAALCFALPYAVYYSIVATFNSNHLDSDIGILESIGLLNVEHNAVLYFVGVGFMINLLFGFTYGVLASALTLWVEKAYFILLIPLLYYLVASSLTVSFQIPILSPLIGITYNGHSGLNLLHILVPLILPLLIGVTLIVLHFKRGDKLGV